jgi:hypothetical protein
MTRTIFRERIPSTDPRLKRHVHHDSESRRYAFDTTGLSIVSAKHTRRIPVLDQGQLGSCTGNAGIGCLGTDPFYEGTTWHYSFTEEGAVQLYSDATAADDYPGQYPPDDTGSDGLTIAKVLTAAGSISGYRHTFSLDDALKALGVTPVICGTTWLEGMFDPAPDGRLTVSGAVAGGHEYVVDEIDADSQRVWLTNSWGTGWGVNGRAYLTFTDWGRLLADQGDVTIFTPLTQPAPVPAPDVDHVLALAAHTWIGRHHTSIAGNARMASALRRWLAAKGL